MLAKQAWRLLHHMHSLFYRVYKARYFPNCSFLEAEFGHKPFFVWRSLIATREVVVRGLRWRVGDGSQILVSSSKWLPHRPVFSGDVDHTLRVADLIEIPGSGIGGRLRTILHQGLDKISWQSLFVVTKPGIASFGRKIVSMNS